VDENSGFIVPSANYGLLKEKVLYLYTHREIIEKMGRKARNAAEKYTWTNYHQQIESILQSISANSMNI
jgi:glycosyltransferase involved in cell wall biosynthesis